ncbi:hypothetical protein SAMN05421811_113190 [Nonomuraea wenchangensis]|uniref:Uncharacterized protein n=1 Tax=Nonomuraea wenchangensis TaxID=568860 RepID=A0A1I0LA60_9ACTN|nr:hypothetical protein SAMN05421811_113190 [Nonomuraea wenchangensis]
MRSQSIGRFLRILSTFGQAVWMASELYSSIAPMFFVRGSSVKPSGSVKANPMVAAPWVSV